MARSTNKLVTLISAACLVLILAAQIPAGDCFIDRLMRDLALRRAEYLLQQYPDLLPEIQQLQQQQQQFNGMMPMQQQMLPGGQMMPFGQMNQQQQQLPFGQQLPANNLNGQTNLPVQNSIVKQTTKKDEDKGASAKEVKEIKPEEEKPAKLDEKSDETPAASS